MRQNKAQKILKVPMALALVVQTALTATAQNEATKLLVGDTKITVIQKYNGRESLDKPTRIALQPFAVPADVITIDRSPAACILGNDPIAHLKGDAGQRSDPNAVANRVGQAFEKSLVKDLSQLPIPVSLLQGTAAPDPQVGVLMNIAAGRNALDARMGRMKANDEKAEVERRFAYDKELADEYNHKLLDGKWDHMMDQTHIGYTFWNEPPANAMPAVTELQPGGHELPAQFAAGFTRTHDPVQASGPPPPAGFKGFVEHDNVVAIEAADTASRTGAAPGPHWEELPGFGEGKSAMTLFPVSAASDMNSPAGLNYSVYLYDTADLTLHLRLAPTNNFVPGRGLRLAISVDNAPRQIVDVLEHNTQQDWAAAVSDGARKIELPLTIDHSGVHTLHIWAVDPGAVLERIVIAHGPLKPSYLGPPESPHAADLTSSLQP